jgi:hypothetical protein
VDPELVGLGKSANVFPTPAARIRIDHAEGRRVRRSQQYEYFKLKRLFGVILPILLVLLLQSNHKFSGTTAHLTRV